MYADEVQRKSLLRDGSKSVVFQTNLRIIHIFARSFASNLAPKTVIKFDAKGENGGPTPFRMAIFYEIGPAGLEIGHISRVANQSDFTVSIARANGSNCAGILVAAPVAVDKIPKSVLSPLERQRYQYEIPQVPFGELES
ncbi:hypothetical protein BST61_g7752 [Cercospora zeina]